MPGTGRNWWQVSKPRPTANTPPPANSTCNFYLKQSVCHTFIVTLKYSCIITIGTMFYVPFICTQWEFCVLSHLILTASHSSTLAWQIPWVEEPGRLQSMGSLRVGHDWATSLSRIGEGNGNPLQCSCLENPRDRGAWWAAVYGVTHSRTRLKRLSSSSTHLKLWHWRRLLRVP